MIDYTALTNESEFITNEKCTVKMTVKTVSDLTTNWICVQSEQSFTPSSNKSTSLELVLK